MRTDSAAFAQKNVELAKDPRYVIELAFDSANTVLWDFTSHADAALPPSGLAGSIAAVFKGQSGTSQTLNADTANSSIGNMDFSLVDRSSIVTTTLGGQLALGRSTRKQRARAYFGYQGLAWADYTLVQTQLVTEIAFADGAYKFTCADIQREMRKDLFDLAKTNLALSLDDVTTTVDVYTTTGFSLVAHGSSYSDAPLGTVGYIKIEDEVIRYTGTTSTQFTGCTRGALNTRAVPHNVDATAADDRHPSVTEYVYLELPAIDLIYRLLTGKDQFGASVMPATWNLGIATSYVRLSDFTGIGKDLWDTTDPQQGFVVRFEDLGKTDGKKFIETELALLCGVFMPIYADGALGCKRMANMLAGAAYTRLLDESNIVGYGDLVHDFGALHNLLDIAWNWEPLQGDFTRHNALIDAASIAKYGRADPLKLKFRGLHGSRHSSAIIAQRFDSLRDRFTGPPIRLDVSVVPSLNVLEVGDVVRVRLANVRDYTAPGGGGPIDRSFEIQNITIDWVTGNLKLKLFASSQAPGAIAATSDATVLTHAWYIGSGTQLVTGGGLTVSGSGPIHISGIGTITGDADMNAAGAIRWLSGDVQIDPGSVVTIAQNVQLRIEGFLQNNGTINGKGGGLAGAAAVSSPASDHDYNPGTVGFIGTTEAGGGFSTGKPGGFGTPLVWTCIRGGIVSAPNAVVPSRNLSWNGTVLSGIPGDMRGTSGSSGMPATSLVGPTFAPGGAGGRGGAGLAIICRGFAQGVAGKVDLSGGPGSPGSANAAADGRLLNAGGGGGGAPGALLMLLDGAGVTATDLTEAGFVAVQGVTPITGVPLPAPVGLPALSGSYSYFVGFGDGAAFPLPSLSGARGGNRVQYVPANLTPAPDLQDVTQLQDAFLLNNWTSQPNPSAQTLNAAFFARGAAPYPYVCAGRPARNTAANILVSVDAATWEMSTSPTAQPIYAGAWNGTAYVLVGDAPNSGSGLLLRSTDGVTWTQQTPPAAEVALRDIAWVPWLGLFVAVGNGTWTGGTFTLSSRIWTSPTGVTWTARSGTVRGLSVAFSNNLVVVAGDAGGTLAGIQTSPDGITWTSATIDSPSGYAITGLAYGNNIWVGAGGENNVVVSRDGGANWVRAFLPLFHVGTGIVRKVRYSGQVFAIAGVGESGSGRGAVVVGRNGTDWQPRVGVGANIFGFEWAGNFWIATGAPGAGGYIATSIRK